MVRDAIIEVKHMDKQFGSTVALNNVNLTVKRGQILGLIGENGSGKSTVTSIISGMQKADKGEMFYQGEQWQPDSMLQALEFGIGMIVQESGTVPGITVAENIFLGESHKFKSFSIGEDRSFGFVNRKKMMVAAKKALDGIGATHILPDMITDNLDLQDRKLIEIAKVMNKNPDVLIVDKTTTALSVLASVFNLPVFVTTIAMLSILNALILMLISINGTGSQITVPSDAVIGLDKLGVKILVLFLFAALCIFVFNYTKTGRKQKFIGGNINCAKLTGLSAKKMSIIAFIMAGLGVGIGAFLCIIYAPTLTKNTASSVGMDVIIAIVFGGMPVSGGARSKITAALIGAFSMTFLSQIMTLFNLNMGIGQMVKAVIFLFVVFVATSNQRSKMLPR